MRRARLRNETTRQSEGKSDRQSRTLTLPVINIKGCAAIHAGVQNILWNFGMIVEDPEARKILMTRGCRDKDGRLCYPPDLVEEAISKTPNAIAFYTQDGALAFTTNDTIPRFGTAVNCVNILDPLTDVHRPC